MIEKQGDTLDEAGQKGNGVVEQEGALATINGQKDVLTLSSSILQVMIFIHLIRQFSEVAFLFMDLFVCGFVYVYTFFVCVCLGWVACTYEDRINATYSHGWMCFQDQWSLVLELATDTTPVVGGQKADKASDARNASVRRQAMIVVDAVYRNGLVAPWLGVPTLVALTTDPCR